MTLLGSSITAWAAAGVFADAECCCPSKAKCKCHDHDGEHDPAPKLKRCGGDAKRVAPAVTTAVAPAPEPIASDVRVTIVVASGGEAIPDDRTIEPEKPPF
jgi:hypothetical protein